MMLSLIEEEDAMGKAVFYCKNKNATKILGNLTFWYFEQKQ